MIAAYQRISRADGDLGKDGKDMIHYVLASHGNYAREALNSAKMICGEDTDRMNLLSVQDDGDGIDRFGTEAAALAENLRGEPVLIMADLFGGSPFMTLLSAFRDTEYVCLTGFNLAMVIQMLQYDGDDLHELAEDIASIGKDVSIRLIPKIIPEEQND